MTWRAVLHRDGADLLKGCPDTPLPRGTLMLETRLTASEDPQTILAMPLTAPDVGTLTLKVVPGGLVLVIARRGEVFHAAVKMCSEARLDSVRILYSWDMKGGAGRLAIEKPGGQKVRWSHTGPAVPLCARDLARLGEGFDLATAHPDLLFAALSDIVEPLGPTPGLAAKTPISTIYGPRAVSDIQRADQLIAPEGDDGQIVLAQVSRIVPAFGSFAPVRLRAPYFGLTRDTIVAPDQRLIIGGSEVEYTFGCEFVLVPARHLVNGIAARWDETGPLVQYAQCILPDHAPICAAGCRMESLFVGRIRRNQAALKASLLSDIDPIFLPEQARAPYRELSPFEAITLAEQRAA